MTHPGPRRARADPGRRPHVPPAPPGRIRHPLIRALSSRPVDASAHVDLNHGKPVASGHDDAPLRSSELMSNSDDEEVASVVIDTILLFPTHPDLARTISGPTLTTSRAQLDVIGHGTKCTLVGPPRSTGRRCRGRCRNDIGQLDTGPPMVVAGEAA